MIDVVSVIASDESEQIRSRFVLQEEKRNILKINTKPLCVSAVTKKQIREYFAKLGKKGGQSTSEKKIAACRATAAARRKKVA